MDIFSHGLWAGVLYKFLNLKIRGKKKFNFWLAVFFGVFPDLFAFAIPFVWNFFNILIGKSSGFPHPDATEPATQALPMFQLANHLYNFSHSIIIFALVFAIAFFIFRKKSFILGAWLLHILMDIPTHTYKFFPTPVFWPLAGWKFSGFSWANPWFLAVDYGLLIIVYSWLIWKERKMKSKKLRN